MKDSFLEILHLTEEPTFGCQRSHAWTTTSHRALNGHFHQLSKSECVPPWALGCKALKRPKAGTSSMQILVNMNWFAEAGRADS